ncbi:MAG: ABC transporter ATP-binding protein [Acutalibacteraceae bacterium]
MTDKKKSKRTFRQDLRIIKRAVKLINTSTPHLLFHINLFSFCTAATIVTSNYITAAIVDELVGNRNLKKLAILIACYSMEIVFRVVQDKSWRNTRSFHIIANKWEEMLLNEKNFSMDYKNMEDSKIKALRQTITDSSGESARFSGLVGRLVTFFNAFWRTVLCFGVSLEMFFQHSGRALFGVQKFMDSSAATLIFFGGIALLTLFNYKANGKYSRRIADNMKHCAYSGRLLHYYLNDYLDDSKAGKDVHIFSQKRLIRHSSDLFYWEWKKHKDKWFENEKKKSLWHNAFWLLMTALTYLYVAVKVYIGAFGLGGFIKYQWCVSKISSASFLFATAIAYLRANNDFLELFFAYLDIPTEMHYGTIPTEKRMDNKYDIEFHHVSFKYPGSEQYVIQNLNLKFRVGDRIAVVGRNGSGKTTMIKLLCRLYDPTEGIITLNGIDIQKYDYEDYLRLFSVVFQDFKLFSFSVGENVAASVDYDEEKVWTCLEKAGMRERVEHMPKGLKTPVYKDFEEDGVEISGGEAQKLAIARALYKDAAFVILDEPTASLDPIAEHEIYSRFNDMVKDKTAVYISHRLSSCRFCDRILVFDNGQLVQNGTHEALLQNPDGKYSELWNAQAQYYAENQEQ